MKQTACVERMAGELADAGVRRGGVILVHSAMRALGPLPLGADLPRSAGLEWVVRGLLEAIGPAGTLLFPALSYQHVTPWQPRFDLRLTPSNIGALPEYFRTRPGTRRSLHPTHSVCGAGPLAAELFADHHRDRTPVGPHSPFRRLAEAGGQVVFLGCGMNPNTSMHGVEELIEPPYLFHGETEYTLVDGEGGERRMTMRNHGFNGWRQRYERLAGLLDEGELHRGRVLAGPVEVIESRAMWEKGRAALERDPFYFVERVADEAEVF